MTLKYTDVNIFNWWRKKLFLIRGESVFLAYFLEKWLFQKQLENKSLTPPLGTV